MVLSLDTRYKVIKIYYGIDFWNNFIYKRIATIFINNQNLNAEMYHRCRYVRLCAAKENLSTRIR